MSGTTHEHDQAAQHSMVLFGEKALFLMHMAAFDPTHNDQVILEVGLAKDGADPEAEYRKDRKTSGAPMYSIKPEAMVLSDLKAGSSFTGELHRGNFELDPDPMESKVKVTIKGVVRLQQLDPETKSDPDAGRRYLCFGPSGDLFAVHEITFAPSFDQVIPIIIDDKEFADLSFTTATPLRLAGVDSEQSRLKSGERAEAHLPEAKGPNGEDGVRTKIVVGDEIFFDSGFLQE